jgi:heavy metal translocating P-type ATPase
MTKHTPYRFDDYFSSDMEEAVSPFLTKKSRIWAHSLPLKISIIGALFFLFALGIKHFSPNTGILFLSFAYFIVGTPSLIQSLDDLFQYNININMLMSVAAIASILLNSPYEGAFLLVLFQLSLSLEKMVNFKAKATLQELKKLQPDKVIIMDEENHPLEKSIHEVEIGEKIVLYAHEIVPLDGKIVKGSSFLNLAHLTGETTPVYKTVGDQVFAGSKNEEGGLIIEVEKKRSDSTLQQIIHLITRAQEAKPKTQILVDQIGKYYSISIFLLTVLLAILLPLIFSFTYLGHNGSFYRALSFMIAASPCALIIATPIAYLSSLSIAAKKGIIIKGAKIFDILTKATTICFDKTGTLTSGELTLEKIIPLIGTKSEKEILSYASALEQFSTHPIAKAIIKLSQEKKIIPALIENIQTIKGSGVEASLKENLLTKNIYFGLIEGIKPKLNEKQKKKLEEGFSEHVGLISILVMGEEMYLLYFSETLRTHAKSLIESLKEMSLECHMVTGDNLLNAKHVAQKLGIDHVHADLRPEEKLQLISSLSAKKDLIMVGDGINDAPSLSRASVGISLGKEGSATAVDVSDVVLLKNDLSLISYLLQKAKRTQRIVYENLSIASLIILIASIPALLGWIPLWIAVLLHEGGTLIVGLNSLRLLKK